MPDNQPQPSPQEQFISDVTVVLSQQISEKAVENAQLRVSLHNAKNHVGQLEGVIREKQVRIDQLEEDAQVPLEAPPDEPS